MALTKVDLPIFDGTDKTFDFTIAEGEYLLCPCSTKAAVYGPVTVQVTRWRDGGIDITGEAGAERLRPDIVEVYPHG